MIVGDRLVDVLCDRGTGTSIGVPGTRSLPPNEAIAVREDIRSVTVRHEPSAPRVAWRYAETSGRPRGTKAGPLE